MARIATTNQKKNTTTAGIAYPPTALVLAMARSYPPFPDLYSTFLALSGNDCVAAPGPLRLVGSPVTWFTGTMARLRGPVTTRDAHTRLLEQGKTAGVRGIVADSWLRSVAAGIEADTSAPPITLDQGLLRQYRAEHPLAQIFPLLNDVLGQAAQECDAVMAVADDRGQLLWVAGAPSALRRAEAISFVEGAQWDERHAGTNAPGTALRLDAPVTIRAAK